MEIHQFDENVANLMKVVNWMKTHGSDENASI